MDRENLYIATRVVEWCMFSAEKTSMPKDERNYGRAFENDAFNPKSMILRWRLFCF